MILYTLLKEKHFKKHSKECNYLLRMLKKNWIVKIIVLWGKKTKHKYKLMNSQALVEKIA